MLTLMQHEEGPALPAPPPPLFRSWPELLTWARDRLQDPGMYWVERGATAMRPSKRYPLCVEVAGQTRAVWLQFRIARRLDPPAGWDGPAVSEEAAACSFWSLGELLRWARAHLTTPGAYWIDRADPSPRSLAASLFPLYVELLADGTRAVMVA